MSTTITTVSERIKTDEIFELTFTLQRVTQRKPDSDWAVIHTDYHTVQTTYSVKTHITCLHVGTVVGRIHDPLPGATYHCHARLEQDDGYYGGSWQYRITDIAELVMPADREALIKLLKRISGVGTQTAELIAESLGIDCIRIIATDPSVLDDLRIKKSVKETIIVFCQDHTFITSLRQVMTDHGIPQSLLPLLAERLASEAALGDILRALYESLSFSQADEIAANTGADPDGFDRGRYVVREAVLRSLQGDSCLLLSNLRAAVDRLLSRSRAFQSVSYTDGQLQAWAETEFTICRDIPDYPLIYPTQLYEAERQSAELTARLLSRPGLMSPSIYDSSARSMDMSQYDADQQAAIRTALTAGMSLITGGPGTGKTYTVRGIIETIMRMRPQTTIQMMSPTARAAMHLSEVVPAYRARTLHSGLGIDWNGDCRGSKLSADLIIVDECSMIQSEIYAALVQSLPQGSALVLVGDLGQLEPVGSGSVIGSLMRMADAGVIPAVDLRTIHRVTEGSSVATTAHTVRLGSDQEIMRMDLTGDVHMTDCGDSEILDRVLQYVHDLRDSGIAVEDIMVLAPVHAGLTGRMRLNACLQELLNPAREDIPEIVTDDGTIWRVGDRVMNLKNIKSADMSPDHVIANGSIGRLTSVTRRSVTAEFDTGERTYTLGGSISELTHAYASTVHKAQGSEAEYVIMPVSTDMIGSPLLRSRLLYTGLTRARHHVEIIGSRQAFLRGCCRRGIEDHLSLFELWFENAMAAEKQLQDWADAFAE